MTGVAQWLATRGPLVLLIAAFGLGAPGGRLEAQAPSQRLPTFAPDFTRVDLAGASVHLGAYRGKVVLLNFWATWCAPCRAEGPRFSGWQQKYAADGLQVLGIAMDDSETEVRTVVRKDRLAYPVVMGDEQLGELYGGVLGLPLSYLIGPDGRIVARYQGVTDLTQLELRIKALLPGPTR